MTSAGDEERLFLYGGTVAHLCHHNLYDQGIMVSRCGLSDYRWTWRGTGSQEEYEQASAMRICRRCEPR